VGEGAGRRLLHTTRSVALEYFHEQCTGIFDGHSQGAHARLGGHTPLCSGAIFVYQLALLHRPHIGANLRVRLKDFYVPHEIMTRDPYHNTKQTSASVHSGNGGGRHYGSSCRSRAAPSTDIRCGVRNR